MKSRIFTLCYLVLTILSTLKGQEQSQTFSPLGIRTVLNASVFTDYPYSPNPIGTDTSSSPRGYRVGASFDISSILNYVYITRAELIIDLRVRLGGSAVSIKKLSQNVNNYSDASTFWNDIGSGSSYRSGVSPTGSSQIISFSSADAFVNDIRSAQIGNDIVSIGFISELVGRNTLNNLYSVSLKVYYKDPGVIVKNDFEGVSAGQLKVDGITYNSPVERNWPPEQIHSAEAIDNQLHNNFTWKFKRWRKVNGPTYPDGQLSITISSTANQEHTTYEAVFKPIFNVTLQNNFGGSGNGGQIKLNGGTVNSPFSFQVTSDSTFTIEAITPTTFNGVPYEFVNWSPDGSTTNPRTVRPTGHTTYTANFRIPPPPAPTNLVITNAGQAFQSPILSWQYTSPPSDFRHFKVYRRYWDHLRGWYGDWQLIGSPTQSSFTDGGETMDPNSIVSAYYHVTAVNVWGAESNQSNWVNTKVFGPPTRLSDSKEQMRRALGVLTLPDQFALSQNFPNPFNPETEISFALPEPSTVRLTVLDILGREIVVLEDGLLPAGHRTARWNGRNTKGEPVGSGVYFYRITALGESGKTFSQTMKMLVTK